MKGKDGGGCVPSAKACPLMALFDARRDFEGELRSEEGLWALYVWALEDQPHSGAIAKPRHDGSVMC